MFCGYNTSVVEGHYYSHSIRYFFHSRSCLSPLTSILNPILPMPLLLTFHYVVGLAGTREAVHVYGGKDNRRSTMEGNKKPKIKAKSEF